MNLFVIVPLFILTLVVSGFTTLWFFARYELPKHAQYIGVLPVGAVFLTLGWFGGEATASIREFLLLGGAVEVVLGVGGLLLTMKALDQTGLVRRSTPLKWERH